MHFKASDIQVSIHASVKDATAGRRFPHAFIEVSIHASVKDATRHFTCHLLDAVVFQSTHL